MRSIESSGLDTKSCLSLKKQDTKLLPITSPNINDFRNSFNVRFSRKFVTKLYLNTPPNTKCVATLPCEISVFKKSFAILNEYVKQTVMQDLATQTLF